MRNHIEFKPFTLHATHMDDSQICAHPDDSRNPRRFRPVDRFAERGTAARRGAPIRCSTPGIWRGDHATARLVDKYCVTCHNQRLKTGGLTLDSPDLANVAAHPDVWEKVIRKVEAGMMPPAGVPRPDAATRKALVANLEGVLDRAAKASPESGSSAGPSAESRRVRERDSRPACR